MKLNELGLKTEGNFFSAAVGKDGFSERLDLSKCEDIEVVYKILDAVNAGNHDVVFYSYADDVDNWFAAMQTIKDGRCETTIDQINRSEISFEEYMKNCGRENFAVFIQLPYGNQWMAIDGNEAHIVTENRYFIDEIENWGIEFVKSVLVENDMCDGEVEILDKNYLRGVVFNKDGKVMIADVNDFTVTGTNERGLPSMFDMDYTLKECLMVNDGIINHEIAKGQVCVLI